MNDAIKHPIPPKTLRPRAPVPSPPLPLHASICLHLPQTFMYCPRTILVIPDSPSLTETRFLNDIPKEPEQLTFLTSEWKNPHFFIWSPTTFNSLLALTSTSKTLASGSKGEEIYPVGLSARAEALVSGGSTLNVIPTAPFTLQRVISMQP